MVGKNIGNKEDGAGLLSYIYPKRYQEMLDSLNTNKPKLEATVMQF